MVEALRHRELGASTQAAVARRIRGPQGICSLLYPLSAHVRNAFLSKNHDGHVSLRKPPLLLSRTTSPAIHYAMGEEADPTLPVYAEEGTDINSSIQQLLASAPDLDLPITAFYQDSTRDAADLRQNIVQAFFDAIRNKNQDVVATMLENNYVSPNVLDSSGMTPLLASVADGNIRMVQCLVDFEAEIDGFGDYHDSQRTPLQVAACTGNLALVRLFVEVFHADDSIVAPDGQLALRLAASSGHHDVANYLPPRRGGGLLRWKKHNEKALQRMQHAVRDIRSFVKFFVWDLPKYFLWTCPKEFLVLPAKKHLTWCWNNRHLFGAWCKRQAQELPQRVKRAGVAIKNWIIELPRATAKAAKKLWHYCTVTLPREIREFFTKRIPAMSKFVWQWLKNGAAAAANSLARIFRRIASFLHTVFVSIISFFRSITLKDLWHGLCNILHEIFIHFPTKLWSWVRDLPEMACKAMEALLGGLGVLLWWIGFIFVRAITWIPEQLFIIVSSLCGSVAKGCHEILVWIDPKR